MCCKNQEFATYALSPWVDKYSRHHTPSGTFYRTFSVNWLNIIGSCNFNAVLYSENCVITPVARSLLIVLITSHFTCVDEISL